MIPSLIVTDLHVNTTTIQSSFNAVENSSQTDTENLKNQILVLVSISTGISILNLLGMFIFYDQDPVAPNKAERRRSTVQAIIPQHTARQKIRKYFKSIKNIIQNKNCRYLIVSQRKNS